MALSLHIHPLLLQCVIGLFLLLIELQLLPLLLIRVLVVLERVLHLFFQFIQVLHLLHVSAVLLSVLLIDACLAILKNDHLLEDLVFLLRELVLLIDAVEFLHIIEVNLVESATCLGNLLLLLLCVLDFLFQII